jgi:hypothetical protein
MLRLFLFLLIKRIVLLFFLPRGNIRSKNFYPLAQFLAVDIVDLQLQPNSGRTMEVGF